MSGSPGPLLPLFWFNVQLASGVHNIAVEYKVLRQKLSVTLSVVLHVLKTINQLFIFTIRQAISRQLINFVPARITVPASISVVILLANCCVFYTAKYVKQRKNPLKYTHCIDYEE